MASAIRRSNIKLPFKEKYTLRERRAESKRILEKYPDRIPVIVQRSPRSSEGIPEIDKSKYLVPQDLTIGQFIYVIRRRMKLESTKALYVFTEDGTIPPTASLMSSIYNKYKGKCSFLYILYSGESTFGSNFLKTFKF